jgi:hypothetical protein
MRHEYSSKFVRLLLLYRIEGGLVGYTPFAHLVIPFYLFTLDGLPLHGV